MCYLILIGILQKINKIKNKMNSELKRSIKIIEENKLKCQTKISL
jgi:hypothetical protein